MDQEPQVVKEASTPSLSAATTIGYLLAKTPDGNIHIRLTGNSGNGYFNGYWVPLPKILALLDEQDGPFIWSALCPLFEGRSVNSACFLMAVLLAEGLVQPSKEKPRRYEQGDPKAFMAKVQALMAPKLDKTQKGAKPATIDPPADSEAPPATNPVAATKTTV